MKLKMILIAEDTASEQLQERINYFGQKADQCIRIWMQQREKNPELWNQSQLVTFIADLRGQYNKIAKKEGLDPTTVQELIQSATETNKIIQNTIQTADLATRRRYGGYYGVMQVIYQVASSAGDIIRLFKMVKQEGTSVSPTSTAPAASPTAGL